MPAGGRTQTVRFLRCANGANIELFEFDSPDQREEFPRPSVPGIQHLAVYVDDLDAAVEHLLCHRVKLMSGPNPLPGPEAGEGNRFIYARTPWGLTIELISYPASMVYEQHSERPALDAHANRRVAAQAALSTRLRRDIICGGETGATVSLETIHHPSRSTGEPPSWRRDKAEMLKAQAWRLGSKRADSLLP